MACSSICPIDILYIRLNLELASEELMFHSLFIKYQFATFESLKVAILVPCITYCFYIFPLRKFCFQSTIHGESNSQNLFCTCILQVRKISTPSDWTNPTCPQSYNYLNMQGLIRFIHERSGKDIPFWLLTF